MTSSVVLSLGLLLQQLPWNPNKVMEARQVIKLQGRTSARTGKGSRGEPSLTVRVAPANTNVWLGSGYHRGREQFLPSVK